MSSVVLHGTAQHRAAWHSVACHQLTLAVALIASLALAEGVGLGAEGAGGTGSAGSLITAVRAGCFHECPCGDSGVTGSMATRSNVPSVPQHAVPHHLGSSHLQDTGCSTGQPARSSSYRRGSEVWWRASVAGWVAAQGPAAPPARRSPGTLGAAVHSPPATALPGSPAGRQRAGMQAAGAPREPRALGEQPSHHAPHLAGRMCRAV